MSVKKKAYLDKIWRVLCQQSKSKRKGQTKAHSPMWHKKKPSKGIWIGKVNRPESWHRSEFSKCGDQEKWHWYSGEGLIETWNINANNHHTYIDHTSWPLTWSSNLLLECLLRSTAYLGVLSIEKKEGRNKDISTFPTHTPFQVPSSFHLSLLP